MIFCSVDKTIIISEHNLKLNWNDFYNIYTSNINSNIPQLHLFIFIKVASTFLVTFKTSIHPSLWHLLHYLLGPQNKAWRLIVFAWFLIIIQGLKNLPKVHQWAPGIENVRPKSPVPDLEPVDFLTPDNWL